MQTPSTARTQRFYGLPKTHKPSLKIRPIVSACGGIFDGLSWLLQFMLKPLLKFVPARLTCTADLIERFQGLTGTQLKNKIPVSFDAASLKTNVDAKEAIDTALTYARKTKVYPYGLTLEDLWGLLTLLLDNNVFHYKETYYKQIRGLVMGNRLSGTLAILVMDSFEKQHMYSLSPKLLIYVRYVHDIGSVIDNNENAHKMLRILNSKHPTIKFEIELSDAKGFLPILVLKIKIDENGQLQYKLHHKKANKGITLHHTSHHPRAVKRTMVQNELRRAEQCSTQQHRAESMAVARTKLLRNGYPWADIQPTKPRKKKKEKSSTRNACTNFPFYHPVHL